MSKSSEPVSRSLRPRSSSPVRPVAETFSTIEETPKPSVVRTKTSLVLDVEVYRQARIAAIGQGCTVSEFIEKAIRDALAE